MVDLDGRSASQRLKALAATSSNIGKGDSRIVRIRDSLAAMVSAYTLISNFYNNAKHKAESFNFSVVLEEDDDLFDDVQIWLLSKVPPVRQKHLRAFTHQQSGRSAADADPWDDEQSVGRVWKVLVENVATRPFTVTIDGHEVQVSYEEPEGTLNLNSENSSGVKYSSQAKLNFVCKSAAGRDAVLALFNQLAAKYTVRHVTQSAVYRCTGYGSWTRFFGPPRKLETVILDGDLKDDVMGDLRRFLRQESKYGDLGLPYHRGYMLHGPPGTGKTSLARAMAAELNLDLYYIPLSDVRKDADLSDLLGRVNRGLLLLEDIDVVRAATERNDDGEGITMTGLLNALDGAVTPHGLITVMTTNRLDAIDPALIRPGRADRVIELGYLRDGQMDELVKAMLGLDFIDLPSVKNLKMTAADIVEKIKYHLDDDPEMVAKEIADLITTTRRNKNK